MFLIEGNLDRGIELLDSYIGQIAIEQSKQIHRNESIQQIVRPKLLKGTVDTMFICYDPTDPNDCAQARQLEGFLQTGQVGPNPAIPQTGTATPQKRKRRTKAEIEADKMRQAANANLPSGMPPQPQATPVQAGMPPQPQTAPVQGGMPPSPQAAPVQQPGMPPQPPAAPVQGGLPAYDEVNSTLIAAASMHGDQGAEKIKAIIAQMGYTRLMDCPAERYPELLQRVSQIPLEAQQAGF